jgi:deoxyribonucleoside regulator
MLTFPGTEWPMNDLRLLTKIATLYYTNDLTQEEIADRLGLSRQKVGRLLKQAKREGVVQISIHSPLLFSAELEYQLEQCFGLAEALVVEPRADTESAIKEAIGEAAAGFLPRRIVNGDIIGISWSSVLLECALRLERTERKKITVVQMNGSLDRSSYSTRAEYIIHRISQAFGGEAQSLVAPMLVDRPEIKDSLLTDSRIAATLDLASRTTVALFGVGNVSEQSSLYKAGYVDDAMLAHLLAAGAVGDICGRFFDAEGVPCAPDIAERTLAVDLDVLRRTRLSVAVAGTLAKIDAILAMLAGRYCNVLITDVATAQTLLEKT